MIVAILHNIRSAHNVGSIFRTADAAGISKLYLSGYTPAPIDRFGRPVKEIAKTALGAEKTVTWEKSESVKKVIVKLKREKFKIICVEQTSKSNDYRKVKLSKKTAFVFGNEVMGLPKSLLVLADEIAEIPIRGRLRRHRKTDKRKESLNISVAFGIILFRV